MGWKEVPEGEGVKRYISSPNTWSRISIEVNWAKNNPFEAVFVAEVKRLENTPFAQELDFPHFGRNFIFAIGPIFLGIDLNTFLA